MRSEWSPEELVESWTLLGDDRKRVANKSGTPAMGDEVLERRREAPPAHLEQGAEVLLVAPGSEDQRQVDRDEPQRDVRERVDHERARRVCAGLERAGRRK